MPFAPTVRVLRGKACGLVAILASAALWACATYETAPLHEYPEETQAGGAALAGTAGHAPSPNAFGGSGGHAGAAAAGGGAGGSAVPLAGSAGASLAGDAGGAGEEPMGSAGAPNGLSQTWTFDAGDEGWSLREQSSELATSLSTAPGALQLVDVPFSAVKQYVDLAYEFQAPADLRGRTLRATVQRSSGGFVGAQLYVYGGAWVSPGFESLSSGDALLLTLALDGITNAGFTPAAVARIGVKLSTGSNASNAFEKTTIELSEVTLE